MNNQNNSSALNGGMHASIFVKIWGDAGGGDAGRIALAEYAFDLGRKAAPADRVQGGMTLTDADIEGIAREHDVGWTSTLGSMVKFARAILSRQNSIPANAAAANGNGQGADYTVDDVELAKKILVFMGHATSDSLEPGVDTLRDRLAERIAIWRPAAPTHQPAPQTSGKEGAGSA